MQLQMAREICEFSRFYATSLESKITFSNCRQKM